MSMATSAIKNPTKDLISSMSASKTWTPHLYDYNTKLREFANAGRYLKFGKICIAWIQVNNLNFSGITQMMQIRNLPCNVILGGSLYFAGLKSGAGALQTIQMDSALLIRPNVVSSDFTDPSNPGWTTIFFIGVDN